MAGAERDGSAVQEADPAAPIAADDRHRGLEESAGSEGGPVVGLVAAPEGRVRRRPSAEGSPSWTSGQPSAAHRPAPERRGDLTRLVQEREEMITRFSVNEFTLENQFSRSSSR